MTKIKTTPNLILPRYHRWSLFIEFNHKQNKTKQKNEGKNVCMKIWTKTALTVIRDSPNYSATEQLHNVCWENLEMLSTESNPLQKWWQQTWIYLVNKLYASLTVTDTHPVHPRHLHCDGLRMIVLITQYSHHTYVITHTSSHNTVITHTVITHTVIAKSSHHTVWPFIGHSVSL